MSILVLYIPISCSFDQGPAQESTCTSSHGSMNRSVAPNKELEKRAIGSLPPTQTVPTTPTKCATTNSAAVVLSASIPAYNKARTRGCGDGEDPRCVVAIASAASRYKLETLTY